MLCDALSVVTLVVVVALVLTTFRDYGITWDEDNHLAYGDRLFAYYQGELNADSVHLDSIYPGAFDLLTAAARRLLPLAPYDSHHLVGGLVGVLGLLGVWRFGRLLFGPVGGFCSLLLLTLTPVYYGHMFNNPKDLPFAVAYVWALHFMSRALLRLPEVGIAVWIKLGLAIGLALGVRIAGLLLPCFLLAVVVMFLVWRGFAARGVEASYRLGRRLLGRVAMTLGIAWGVMLLSWPWAAAGPFSRPLLALSGFSQYTAHKRTMPFGGESIRTTDVPWDYLPRYFAFKLPEIVLILAIAGFLGGAVCVVWRARTPSLLTRNSVFVLLGMAVVLPPLYAIAKGSPLYDGLRHFLFLVPLLCIFAGGVVAFVGGFLVARTPWWGVLVLVVGMALVSGRQLALMTHLHPHEYVYFNSLIGGLPGAHERYDTDYYAESYREALLDLREYLWRTERDRFLNSDYKVNGCFARIMVKSYLPRSFVKKRGAADFWLGYTRKNCHVANINSPVISSVRRFDTPLVVVRDMRQARSFPLPAVRQVQ